MLMIKNRTEPQADQAGFAALVIAIVLVLVLSLITVGFAQLMRHEQTAALDKQLSSQAYYAAETGINDAVTAINQGFTDQKTDCTTPVSSAKPGAATLNSTQVGNNTNASITCLLIDPHPSQLYYNDVGSSETKVAEIIGVNPNDVTQQVPIDSLEISWHDKTGNKNFINDCNSFPTSSTWGTNTGILRLGLTPLNGSQSRDNLISSSFNAYLCPNNAGAVSAPGAINYATAWGNSGGQIVNGKCDKGNNQNIPNANNTYDYCNVYVNVIGQAGSGPFFMNLRSIYNQSSVTITAYSGCAVSGCARSNQVLISGAQILIDSTGKAQNVLRRIQARLPAHNEYNLPSTTAGTGVCKLLQIQPNGITNSCENN